MARRIGLKCNRHKRGTRFYKNYEKMNRASSTLLLAYYKKEALL